MCTNTVYHSRHKFKRLTEINNIVVVFLSAICLMSNYKKRTKHAINKLEIVLLYTSILVAVVHVFAIIKIIYLSSLKVLTNYRLSVLNVIAYNIYYT